MATVGADDGGDDMPKVLMLGSHRAGKSSILKVVFQKMSPHETLFLEPTVKVDVMPIVRNAMMRFKVHDYPSTYQFEEGSDTAALFNKTNVVVFVVDAQEEAHGKALSNAKKVIELAHKVNPKIVFFVLIHKVDGDQFFSEEHKTEIQRDISAKFQEDLLEKIDVIINFHCTSIYDHTIFEAFSKIVQVLIKDRALLENCLDLLITNSRMEKAYLFDVVSKVYIASDPAQPVDIQSYELCSDMIDVVIDVSCIYGLTEDGSALSSSIACDSKSSCVIHLNNRTLLYLKEVDKCLALVCILREENFDRQHLLDYNIKVFKEALAEIFKTSRSVSSPSLTG